MNNPSGMAPFSPKAICASISVKALLKGDRRLEGEAYLTGGYAVRLAVESAHIGHRRLGDLARVWLPGRLKAIQVGAQDGIPFLTATQAFDQRPTPRKWLAPEKTEALSDRFVQNGCILVTRSGNVGQSIMAYQPHLGKIISDDLLRIEPNDTSLRGLLYCFLRSVYGGDMMRSSQYGSIINHLEPYHVGDLPVPIVEQWICDELNQRIEAAFRMREEAFGLSQYADELYEREVGAPPVCGETEMFSVASSEVSRGSRRLDGYHYNPEALRLLSQLRSLGRPIQPLSAVVGRILLPDRLTRTYSSSGLPYLDSEDLFKVNPRTTKFLPEGTRKKMAPYMVRRGWLLMCRSGQIYGINGSLALATVEHEGKVISEDLLRIIPKPDGVAPGYLQVVLGHRTVGRPLVLRLAFGTQIPHIAPGDLEQFPVIRLGEAVETTIAEAAQRAADLHTLADQEENRAVALLEQYLQYHIHFAPREDAAAGLSPFTESGAGLFGDNDHNPDFGVRRAK